MDTSWDISQVDPSIVTKGISGKRGGADVIVFHPTSPHKFNVAEVAMQTEERIMRDKARLKAFHQTTLKRATLLKTVSASELIKTPTEFEIALYKANVSHATFNFLMQKRTPLRN